MKNPIQARNRRLNLANIDFSLVRGNPGRTDGILGNEVADGVGDCRLFLPFLLLPRLELLLLDAERAGVLVNLGTKLRDALRDLVLEPLVLGGDLGPACLEVLLEHALVRVERAVTS